ncbi:hypothetical protein ACIBEJ_34205 [Nonomuraea sp. NPDC050790]|uniref:hypothetical protein n=1 Tax=Nonomuraea sp. NPDC050790 TaxID=3364371 RepID=UPI0037B86107
MSGNDDEQGGGRLLTFPRVLLPGSFDANADPRRGDEMNAAAAEDVVWPRLPGVSEMGPPLALAMPGIPDVDDDEDAGGEFVPPQPDDPDRPTARDTLALAMALLTALGVAAAQGMWHRVRHRQALADEARAHADKVLQKSASRPDAKRAERAGDTASPRSPGGAGRNRSRSPGDRNRSSKGPRTDPPPGPGRSRDRKAPKADRDGKPFWNRHKRKRRKDASADRDPGTRRRRRRADERAAAKTRKNDPDTTVAKAKPPAKKTPRKKAPKPLRWKASKRRPGKDGAAAGGWTAGRPKGRGQGPAKRKRPPKPPKLKWTAPKRRPGGKTKTGRKHWHRRKNTPGRKRRRRWVRRMWKGHIRWVKRWHRRRNRARRVHRYWVRLWRKTARRRAGRTTWHSQGTGSPPPGFEGMRPPPAADQGVWVTGERVDQPTRQDQSEPDMPARERLHAAARPALPAPPSDSDPRPNGAHLVNAHLPQTQYGDADLTIFDVIDADADMAEEITAGVNDARQTVDGCDRLLTKLEALHAKVVELRVPGVLEGMVVRLMETTATVRSRAEAIAARLPAASEAIAVAGGNAAARHQPLADAVRDAGHTRPAERDYHND